ncbi:DUF1428 family protein [Macrococcus animalis]|uniref:DUF1428 family protein n=1 Tax=Macrococcus animalis TaxID=3395467 RepID=UPI0039BEAFE1
MYIELYLYPVKIENQDSFLKINREAEQIYREFGTLESETYIATSTNAQYGCLGMDSAIELLENEIVMIEINRYKNKEHQIEVLNKVDNNERIGELYNEVIKVIDIERTVRGEFKV